MPASLIDQQVQKQVVGFFKNLREPVAILFFGDHSDHCEYCETTQQLLQEIVPLSSLLSLEVFDLEKDKEVAARFHVDKAPGIVLAGKNGDEIVDFRIRYAGIPAGHEFSSLLNDVVLVSRRDSGLQAETREFLSQLQKPVHLQVFVTPT